MPNERIEGIFYTHRRFVSSKENLKNHEDINVSETILNSQNTNTCFVFCEKQKQVTHEVRFQITTSDCLCV